MSVDGPEAGARQDGAIARVGDPTGARTGEGRRDRTEPTVPPACDLTLGVVCTDQPTLGRTTRAMAADEPALLSEQG